MQFSVSLHDDWASFWSFVNSEKSPIIEIAYSLCFSQCVFVFTLLLSVKKGERKEECFFAEVAKSI